MRNVIFDIETNGLLDECTTIHCLVITDLDSDQIISCADQPGYTPISEGLEALKAAERVYGHNILRFDRPVIAKLRGYEIPIEKCRDTLAIAQMRWAHNLVDADFAAHRKGTYKFPPGLKMGSHALKAWGYRLGIHKGAFNNAETDWSRWTPEMQSYCVQDTLVTKALVKRIQQSGGTPAEAVETETELNDYLFRQELNGCPFDLDAAVRLQAKWAARRQELEEELRKVFGSWFKSAGVTTPKRDNKKRGIVAGCPYTKIKLETFNPASRQHIALRLMKVCGWKPAKDQYGANGWPTVDEKVLSGLDQNLPGVKLLLEYLLLNKRLGQLSEGKEAWLRQAKHNPATGLQHIHGRITSCGTITQRGAHSHPNLGQVPQVGKPFGEECRALFCAPPGWVQVGVDAKGLQARCLGHHMARFDGGAYAKVLLEGDVHAENMEVLGFAERRVAKTWYYAYLFGAGNEKLGSIEAPAQPPNKQKALGARARKLFLKKLPALARLDAEFQILAKDPGFMLAPDGRRVYIRSPHAALNTRLMSDEAIICKRWIVDFNRRLVAEFGQQGWSGKWAAMLWVHDEVQLAVRPEIADRVIEILLEEISKLTQHYGWRVPLEGDAKRGRNWAETH